MAELCALELRGKRVAPLRSAKKSAKTAFLREFFGSIRSEQVFFLGTESVSDCFSMQTTLLTCQHGSAGGGAWAASHLLETSLLEVRPTCQLLLFQDLVLDLRLLVELVERVDNDGDGEGDAKNTTNGTNFAETIRIFESISQPYLSPPACQTK